MDEKVAVTEPVGVPSLRVKAFVVEPLVGDGPRDGAELDYQAAPLKLYVQSSDAHGRGLRFSLPDGSNWFVTDHTWEYLIRQIRASREYEAALASDEASDG